MKSIAKAGLSLALRVILCGLGVTALFLVVQHTIHGFNTVVETSNVSKGNQSRRWITFLGGEFTFSCILPTGLHLIQASVRGGRSLSTFVVLSILVGMVLGQIVVVGEAILVDTTILLLLCLAIILHAIVNNDRIPSTSVDNDEQALKPKGFKMIRILIKLGAFLMMLTGVMVLSMGLLASRRPSDLLPSLIWEGFGYKYDIVATYGKETAESKEFLATLICTMLATICQTLLAGVWVWFAPMGSEACQEGLWFSIQGVPFIVLANSITATIYDQSDFVEGRHCMIAHMLLLVQMNAHLPLLWWIHELWTRTCVGSTERSCSASKRKAA